MNRDEMVRLIDALEGEVNNGGFDQFFYNSAGDETVKIIQALEAIGAMKAADIVKRAAGKFPGGMPPGDRFARQDVLLDKVSANADAFADLDQEFYAYPDDLSGLLARYSGE
ncbi:MAG: hypothetical protein DMG79_15400 [Acidobacteria bacterium]|nr:MAG: hypothetical protein DMG79_15400 [Acidobacteriota bacterium]